jgi:hypothetical protein
MLSGLSVTAPVALVLAFLAFALGLVALPRPGARPAPAGRTPVWDLPLRGVCALALVLALTAAAGWLGPSLSGLLAPFPIIASVLATFTHSQRGANELLGLLGGLLFGFGAFALFCFTLAVSLRGLGIAGGFALALALALVAQTAVLYFTRKEPALALGSHRAR